MNPKHYSMLIQWDPRDDIYVVTVPELPGCTTHGRTYEEAVQQGQDAVESWIMVAEELGWPIPAEKTFAAQQVNELQVSTTPRVNAGACPPH
jgi:predicted RNase H-like HicB family nuclease